VGRVSARLRERVATPIASGSRAVSEVTSECGASGADRARGTRPGHREMGEQRHTERSKEASGRTRGPVWLIS
jgi:hypothetical protein